MRTCPPCDSLCRQGRDCPAVIPTRPADLEPEQRPPPGSLIAILLCVIAPIAIALGVWVYWSYFG